MPRRVRHSLPLAMAASLVLTILPAATLAQDEPAAVAITPAGLNADKIDGRHAVGHGASAGKRAGKLVATNRRGQLPSNIVKPAWRLILGKPAAFVDGQISWGEVQNKPGAFADGQIGWGEVQNKPGGFADGVDDVGVAGIKVITVSDPTPGSATTGGGYAITEVVCPTGSKVVGGGHTASSSTGISLGHNKPEGNGWYVAGRNYHSGNTIFVTAYALCLSADPATTISTASKGKKGK